MADYTTISVKGEIMSKKTMTLNLTEDEMATLDELAKRKDISKTGVLRQALRLYQLVDSRTQDGERLVFENEKDKKKSEVVVL
ncbi:MAG: CopG family transcriptional regulator [Planctomycetaceae bacterium]|nr:CopG family transcriptional regulator [Planctomycetaceae bacterium]